MQTVKDIADGRVARGEISLEEHAALIYRLGPPPLAATPPPLPAVQAAAPRASVWPWIAGLGGALAVLLVAVGLQASDGLSVGNAMLSDGRVELILANTSRKAGDVLLWVEQGNLKTCQQITSVAANTRYTVQFPCRTLRSGTFLVRFQWADFDTDAAAVANRI